MRFYIIFGITIVLAIFIYFYYPNIEYIGLFNNETTLNFSSDNEEYEWKYELNNNRLKVEKNNNTFKLIANGRGKTNITFYYTNAGEDESIHKITYYFMIKDNKIYWLESNGSGYYEYPDPS